MSAFLAFRNAAVTVLRPQWRTRLAQTLPTIPYRTAWNAPKQNPPTSDDPKPLKPPPKPKEQAKQPKNNDIPHQYVQVVDANGALEPPQPLESLLRSVDLQTHVVRLVSHVPPIVRVLTRLEDKMNQLTKKAEKKLQGPTRVETAIIQLTWLTAGADYDHKIAKAKEELEKGTRVQVLFKKKPRVRYPSRAEIDEQMDQVAVALEEVGTEWKEREIEKGQASLFFQSRVRKAPKALPSQEEIEAKAKEALQLAERHAKLQKRNHSATPDPSEIWRQ